MKPLLKILFCLLACLGSARQVYATHILGGELYYSHLGGKQYKLTLVLYGDCGGSSFPSLSTSIPVINIARYNTVESYIRLSADAPDGEEITPICQAMLNMSTCNGGSIPGIKRFSYSRVIALADTCSEWNFRFEGALGNSSAGRSSAITNIAPPSAAMNLVATLNNTLGGNSSPVFTASLSPFFCVNKPQQYNTGCVDPDGDELTYALVPALVDPATPAVYQNGYSATSPMSLTGNSIFSPATGQYNFTPAQAQMSTVVMKVTEYRNGRVAGSVMRELNFVVLNNCFNNPPDGVISNSFQTNNTRNSVTICAGHPALDFYINPTDADGNMLNVKWSNLPAGSSFTVSNNNTPNPQGHFTWNTATAPTGIYTFFLTLTDDGCPLSSTQTIAYTIRIVPPPQLAVTQLTQTHCLYKAKLAIGLTGNDGPWQLRITRGGSNVRYFNSISQSYTDSLDAGNYHIVMKSDGATCISEQDFTITDSGQFPFAPALDTDPATYCTGDAATPIQVTGYPGATMLWSDEWGNPTGSTPPTPSTSTTGSFYWKVAQQYKTCVSDTTMATVFVSQMPNAFFDMPEMACEGDIIQVMFTGDEYPGAVYNWNWNGAPVVTGNTSGPYRIYLPKPGTHPVSLQIDNRGCLSVPNTRLVHVQPIPGNQISVADICQGDTAQISYAARQVPNASYSWNIPGATSIKGQDAGPYEAFYNTPGTKTVTLKTTAAGCSSDTTISFQVFPRPNVFIGGQLREYCMGDTVMLQPQGAASYEWLQPQQVKSNNDGYYSIVYQPTDFTVEGTSSDGCSGTATLHIGNVYSCCTFHYPNAFTPNGDGNNDLFNVKTMGNYEQYLLVIYNRWGQEVFRTLDESRGWNGIIGGTPAPSGTYFYYFNAKCYNGKTEERKGDVILLR
jgi:gliding motility-associated-like protein